VINPATRASRLPYITDLRLFHLVSQPMGSLQSKNMPKPTSPPIATCFSSCGRAAAPVALTVAAAKLAVDTLALTVGVDVTSITACEPELACCPPPIVAAELVTLDAGVVLAALPPPVILASAPLT
jgi:hypothetical protein